MRTNLRLLLVAILCLVSLKIEAQQRPNFNVVKKAGIIKYNSEKVIRKLKISEAATKEKILQYIKIYNKEMDRLLLVYSESLEDLQKQFDTNIRIAIQNRDRSQMDGVKVKIKQIIPPIRKKAQRHQTILNENLALLLTGKQYKKWLRYQDNR